MVQVQFINCKEYSSGGELNRKNTTGPEGRNHRVIAIIETNGSGIIHFDDKDMVGSGN
jgi:hypothetical protein